MMGLIGKKIGMTRIFDSAGAQIPVTVLEAGPCHVLQRKTVQSDGYEALQLGCGTQLEQRVSRARKGHCAKAGAPALRTVREFRVDAACEHEKGKKLTVDQCFSEGVLVDVAGFTKGKGFAGVVRRYRMAGGPMSHGGNAKRRPGSIGNCATPSKVQKNRPMPGHMGHVAAKQRNLKVIKVIPEKHLLLVHGAVPGPNGATVIISEALKKKRPSS